MSLNKQELMQSYQVLQRIFPEDLHIARPFIHLLRQRGENKLAATLSMDTARRMLARGNSEQAICLLALCKQLNHPDNEGICTLSGMAQFSMDDGNKEQAGKVFALTRHLSDSETMAFIQQGTLVRVSDHEKIIQQGESSKTFYLILDGVVDVQIRSEKETTSVTVKRLMAGDFFG
ncbi:MAG: cyclic nucleotide-binding domain-containing protein, partial [Mariprofundus sp.]